MRLVQAMVMIAALAIVCASHAQPAGRNLAETYNIKGMELYHQRQYDDAEVWFRDALKEDPEKA